MGPHEKSKSLSRLAFFILVYSRFLLNFFLSSIIAVLFSNAHFINTLICGSSERVLFVSEYSTRGGISGYMVRVMYPSASNVRSVTVSIFCEKAYPGLPQESALEDLGNALYK